jgi:hypothetical protein
VHYNSLMPPKQSPPDTRRPGRPPQDPAGRKLSYRVYLSPSEAAAVEALAGGTVQDGLRELVRRLMHRRQQR